MKEDEGDEDKSKQIKEIEDQHFSKTKPQEFSSEKFKIRIRGLPKRYSFSVCFLHELLYLLLFIVMSSGTSDWQTAIVKTKMVLFSKINFGVTRKRSTPSTLKLSRGSSVELN